MTLGRIYRQTSRHAEALEHYKNALEIVRYLKDESAERIIRGYMGVTYRFLDELDSAVERYRQAIDIAERYQETVDTAVRELIALETLCSFIHAKMHIPFNNPTLHSYPSVSSIRLISGPVVSSPAT